jgi:hypothetical protein
MKRRRILESKEGEEALFELSGDVNAEIERTTGAETSDGTSQTQTAKTR